MAVFVKPAPSATTAEEVMRQLADVRTRFPGVRLEILPPDQEMSVWKVRVETSETDVTTLKQACIDLLGE